ncbi:MAG: hypothetical protein EAZ57_09780 [Cytophagales bacterium]|nr:MAG: hypothetical protein EAZ67_10290 [Cytophagales bacterium]TAF59825.1 MAG: hypothetical protein EAZ57_09780 [Cytophagales bacterium]
MSYIQDIAADLLRLEINTIIVDELTCDKPSNLRRAMWELAEDYRLKIIDIEADVYHETTEQKRLFKAEEALLFTNLTGGEKGFTELREYCEKLLHKLEQDLISSSNEELEQDLRSHINMVDRIRRQSLNMVNIFKQLRREAEANPDDFQGMDITNDHNEEQLDQLEDLELLPMQVSMVRKAYEIGTQQILMQTVVQVEGDITSYITPKFLKLDAQDQNILLGVHNSAIANSTKMWQYLFDTVGKMAGEAFQKLMPGSKRKKLR